jgi:serine/threonine-protein kinase
LVLRDGPLPLVQAVSYTLQVADALAHASQRDVVHRDIKPSNVLITPEGRAKLVDMGLARLHQVAQPDQDLTASGVTLGTFDYISPEQARDPRNADVRSDLYSLGCTLYYMLTGQPPFPEGTVLQKLLQHQADDPTDARQLRPDLPDELSRILRKLLAKSPQHRYQRPDDLVSDLLAVAGRYGLEVPAPSAAQRLATVPAEPPRWIRHMPWLLPLGVLGLVVLGFALLGRDRDESAGPPPIHHAAATAEPGAHRLDVAPAAASADGDSTTAAAAGKTPASGNSVGPSNPDHASIQAANPAATLSSEQKPASDSSTSGPAATAASQTAESVSELLSRIRSRLAALLTDQSPSASAAAPTNVSRVPLAPRPASPDKNSSSPANADGSPSPATSVADSSPAAGVTGAGSTAERKGVLIVDPTADSVRSSGEYTSLADACRAARNGDVIELHASGPLLERPIDLVAVRLTIRAGEGFSPVISFQPQKADPLRESHSMLTLAGSQLAFVGVQLSLDVPRDAVAESWSMAEIRPGESLRLDNCALTIRNASDSGGALHPDVAMFDIRAVPGPGMMSPDDTPIMRPPASLQLRNCILRGEATVVRSNELQPVQLTWTNGLLATTERFLSASGGPSDPKPQGETQLELHHVTALARAGLCRLTNTQDAPQQLPLEITASDCIFLCDASSALIEQSGIDATEDYRRRIVWNGERNFYEGFTTFWRITAAGATTPVQSSLHDWQTYWGTRESSPSLNKVAWQQLPPATRPVHQYVPADFALQAGDNPPRHAAADGTDAGLELNLLPPVSTSEPSPPASSVPRRSDSPSP